MKKQVLSLATAFTLTTGLFAATSDAATHTVKEGDTLWGISKQYDTTVEKIMLDNDLTSTLIFPQEKLEIAAEKASSPAKSGKVTYKVQAGDTLAKISKAYGVSTDELVKWNKLNDDKLIYAGDVLAIAAEGADQAKVTKKEVKKVVKKQAAVKQEAPKQAEQAQPVQKQQAQPVQEQPAQQTQSADNAVRTLTMEATAYTAHCTGCSGITANGTNLLANPGARVIAVDPSVIPLGTKVWVEGYGEAIAADTGGAIKGNRIDVYVQTDSEAYAWGRKSVTVKILN